MGSPRSRIAATMEAAISKAPFSRCLSTPDSLGDEKAKVKRVDAVALALQKRLEQ
jgi:hypothetical protein